MLKNSNNSSFSQDFWNTRWKENQTGWDVGYASPAITDYMTQYENKNAGILIPGCGNAYEAEFLVENGFTNITLIDIAPKLVKKLQEKFENTPQVKVLCEDFYSHQAKYDVIIEQTFFCANPIGTRPKYAKKVAELLSEKGKLVGVLFNRNFEHQGPPFGGDKTEYTSLFSPYFEIKVMEICYNSIKPRKGKELFVNLIKK